MRLYFPVDLTGNLIMTEKLVLGEIWTGDLPIFNPDALTSAPSWHLKVNSDFWRKPGIRKLHFLIRETRKNFQTQICFDIFCVDCSFWCKNIH